MISYEGQSKCKKLDLFFGSEEKAKEKKKED
jgi:hypothetical protein